MSDSASKRAAPAASSFEAAPEDVYRFIGRFLGALRDSGVEHICVSPGSRSTPIAVSAHLSESFQTWVGLDERATAFFALGLAKTTGRPVALVCTSGTAAANYLPAVVEAHYSRVPLLLLTADRPPELRDWGAGQTIEQVGLFGDYVRWAVDLPLAYAGEGALRFAVQLGARAAATAAGDVPGPVHLNWPFREPLPPPPGFSVPAANARPAAESAHSASAAIPPPAPVTPVYTRATGQAQDSDGADLVRAVESTPEGVICVGALPTSAPREFEPLAASIRAFAAAAGWPILADAASGLRDEQTDPEAPLICAGDGLLRAEAFAEGARPRFVLRVGEAPVSKTQRLWLEAAAPPDVWWLDEGGNWGEPSLQATRIVRGGVASLLEGATALLSASSTPPRRAESDWCARFRGAEAAARAAIETFVEQERSASSLSAATAAALLAKAFANGGLVFASNSMSIRYLDLVQGPETGLRVLASRGASGIDGINSTALGAAAAGHGPTALLTGDLAFLHDLSGLLLAKQACLPLTILVLDDDGGGIFSYLPIAQQGEAVGFEQLFGTPHGLDLARVAALFEFAYVAPTSVAALESALAAAREQEGPTLVHVRLDRRENEQAFRRLLSEVAAATRRSIGA